MSLGPKRHGGRGSVRVAAVAANCRLPCACCSGSCLSCSRPLAGPPSCGCGSTTRLAAGAAGRGRRRTGSDGLGLLTQPGRACGDRDGGRTSLVGCAAGLRPCCRRLRGSGGGGRGPRGDVKAELGGGGGRGDGGRGAGGGGLHTGKGQGFQGMDWMLERMHSALLMPVRLRSAAAAVLADGK